LNSFCRSHCAIYARVYTVFTLYYKQWQLVSQFSQIISEKIERE
jgi:hypothetical protein